MPPSLIFSRISYLPSMRVPATGTGMTPPRSLRDCNRRTARKIRHLLPYNGSMAVTSPGARMAAVSLPSARGLSGLFVSARPAQWVKNLVLPLPFLFGGVLATARGWKLAALGFAVFCAITSAIYLVNDVMDRERDRAHPVKRRRPLAAGELGVTTAITAAVALGVAGLAAAFVLSPRFGRWSALYAALMLAYSLWVKRIPFLEALIVA